MGKAAESIFSTSSVERTASSHFSVRIASAASAKLRIYSSRFPQLRLRLGKFSLGQAALASFICLTRLFGRLHRSHSDGAAFALSHPLQHDGSDLLLHIAV